ncbi:MAG: glycosyltransferase family 4 protein [Limisphaerales bacterium]
MRFLMLNWRDPENPLAGGAERVTQGYLAALVARGHEVYWFANAFPGCNPTTTIEGIHIVRGGGIGSSIIAARRWYRAQEKFNLVIDQHHGIAWLAPWWCGTNCVAFIHEVLGPIWDAFYKFPWNTIGKTQERMTHWLYRNVTFWTACESTRDQLMLNGVKRVQIIRYGVHTQALPELEPKSIASGTPLKLAVVSRLAPNKRIDHAMRTVAALKERGVVATLKIVGGGQIEAVLRATVAECGIENAVSFLGPLPEAEKDALMRESHLLLHTSQREGWGLNVIEANAMGTPAAVYPVAGLRESTLDNETGVVARGETPELLAARIAELVEKPALYQKVRTAAWERAKSFHWSRILPIACDWLEEMAQRPRR